MVTRRMFRRLAGAMALSAALLTSPSAADAGIVSETSKKGSVLGIDLEVKSFALDNGLRVFVVEDHSTPMFAFHLAYRVGARDEKTGRTGFAHFFEHMMYKGSENVPDGGHFKHVLGVGGELNAFTTADSTEYFETVPSHYLDMVLWLEADRMKSLAVTEENFENQRNAVLEEMAQRVDNVPYQRAIREFFADVWAGTGYGHMTIGTKEDLNAATASDVKSFFNEHYVPNNAVIAIVGDVDYPEIKRKIDQYFSSVPRGPEPGKHKAIDHSQTKPFERRVEDKLARQALYLLGWKTVPSSHPDRHAVEVLMNVLLRGESSRLTKTLKDERRLVVASIPVPNVGSGEDAGSASGAFIPTPGKTLADIKPVVKEIVAEIKSEGISSKELQKAINQLTVDTVTGMSTNSGRAARIAKGVMFHDDPTFELSELEKYQKVTTGDVKRVANEYLTDNWLVLQVEPAK